MAESSGGLSANRDAAQKEEGNMAPFPDKGGDLRYCHKCSHYKPSRAYHIRVCKRCVQRMGPIQGNSESLHLELEGKNGDASPISETMAKEEEKLLEERLKEKLDVKLDADFKFNKLDELLTKT